MKVKILRRVVALVVWLGLLAVAFAAQEWQQKPFEKWTKEDIIKLSSDSAWAQVREVNPKTGEITPTSWLPAVTLRLRSAMPIRQALVRLRQIEAKYDKMSERDRAAFDEKTRGLLECPACAENYVVTMGPPVSKRQMKNGVGALKNVVLAQLEKRVYLANERGERRELVHFIAPKHDEGEASFFFPRLDEKGQPLLTPDTKKLFFIFEAKNLRTGFGSETIPERFEFDVGKMLVNGQVEF